MDFSSYPAAIVMALGKVSSRRWLRPSAGVAGWALPCWLGCQPLLAEPAPTLVLDGQGRVRLVAGARGGPRIIPATWQVLSNVVDFGMTLAQAVSAPRVHHQWQPDELLVEQAGLLDPTRQRLEQLGHRLRFVSDIGASPAILRNAAGTGWSGMADPRRGGAAAGF